jgi:hypothetical protein
MNPRQLLRMLQCFFIGHRDSHITLTLGKIVPESVEVMRCERATGSWFRFPNQPERLPPVRHSESHFAFGKSRFENGEKMA